MTERRVVLATITRPHGIKGGVKARVFNDQTTLLRKGCEVFVSPPEAEEGVPCTIVGSVPGKVLWMLQLAGIDSIDEAEELRGADLWVPRDALPPLEEGEYYEVDIPGCEVFADDGAKLGVVHDIERYPTADLFIVKLDAGGTVDLPSVGDVITLIDTAARKIIVDRAALEALTTSS